MTCRLTFFSDRDGGGELRHDGAFLAAARAPWPRGQASVESTPLGKPELSSFAFRHRRRRRVQDEPFLLHSDARLRIDGKRQRERLEEGRLDLPNQPKAGAELPMDRRPAHRRRPRQ